MALPSDPLKVIVPIVTVSAAESMAHDLLGTGFLVGKGLIMSARHVLGVKPERGQALAAVMYHHDPPTPFDIEPVYVDTGFDIAVGRISDWPLDDHLDLAASDDLQTNRGVLTAEYSATEQNVPLADGRRAMKLAPNWHQGHIVREYPAEFGHQQVTQCIDLSYPAFKGASGAPVVHADTGDVLGLIVANVERHLLPAHLERVERADGVTEELRYFLPRAQAIRAQHLRDTLTRAWREFGA